MSKFQKLDSRQAELVSQGVLHDPIARLSRKDLLTVQYTKCINYFNDDVDPSWGGQANERDQTEIESGYQRFLEDVDAYGDPAQPQWLRKKLDALCWGPDNFRLSSEPAVEFGYPYEPYLTVNGAILTVNQASRILSIQQMDLVQLKCALLLDAAVVAHAIRKMLEPRPTWPRIKLKPGGKGRTFHFGSGGNPLPAKR